jgi:ribosomal protein L37AE/L43A
LGSSEKEFAMWINDKKLETAQELLMLVGQALDLTPEAIERLSEVDPHYLTEARTELHNALERWNDDHTVPACLACGSQRVDFAGDVGMFRCQDCGAEEDRTGKVRKAA